MLEIPDYLECRSQLSGYPLIRKVEVGEEEGEEEKDGHVTLANHLEDHPRTCKWLIIMVSQSPNWGYSPSKWAFHGV